MNESYAASISKEIYKDAGGSDSPGADSVKKNPWEDLLRLKSWELGYQAERFFPDIDADNSGTLSKLELTNSSQDGSDERRQEVAKVLLAHFDEAKEMATQGTPFGLSRWSLSFAGDNFYRKYLGEDKAADISLRDVKAMSYVNHGAGGLEMKLDYRPTELFTGYSTGLIATGVFATTPFLPGPAKAVALLGGAALLATSLRNSFFSSEKQYIREIYDRKDQISSWFPHED